MKNFIRRLILMSLIQTGLSRAASEPETPPAAAADAEAPVVYLIPIRQPIMHPQLFLVRRGVEKALEAEADAIIFLMDTPGGRVDLTQDMVATIIDVGIPTYTLVERNAFSAGAIIAASTDKIYMQPLSNIGAATPVMMTQEGYMEMGEAEREKLDSGMDAIVRGIAQAKGRDELLIRSMVRRQLEVKLEDGTVISPAGTLTTLTNQEAERILPDGSRLLSEGTVSDLDELLEQIGYENAERIELIPSLADDLAVLITRYAGILISLAMLLLYLEFQSPGIGWAGGGAAALFAIVMYGHNVAGLSGIEDVVFLALGLVLILVEIFVLPGFGIAGISGILLIGWGLISAMTTRFPGNPGKLPGFENIGNVDAALTNISVSIIGAAVLLFLLIRTMGDRGLLGRGLVLADDIQPAVRDTSARSLQELIGKSGRTVTPLRPGGSVEIDGRVYDAVSDGDYVDSGTSVQVAELRNHRLIVNRNPETPA